MLIRVTFYIGFDPEQFEFSLDLYSLFFSSPCDQSLSGGYDDQTNQVIICSNNCTTASKVEATLSHELIHMYDYCTARIDFKNKRHLACSEIRAATHTSCSKFSMDFWSFQGYRN